MNIKITIEYDGTRYHGWQIQSRGETIQAVLEQAVSTFLKTPTRITGSGRTDAGVHALGQVANFFSHETYGPHRIRRALNALTPDDIAIKEVEIVPDSFDARRDGRSRVYEYHILNRPTKSPFYLNRAWHLHESLDLEAMRNAITCLLGEHDFSSFQAAACDAEHAVSIERVVEHGAETRLENVEWEKGVWKEEDAGKRHDRDGRRKFDGVGHLRRGLYIVYAREAPRSLPREGCP